MLAGAVTALGGRHSASPAPLESGASAPASPLSAHGATRVGLEGTQFSRGLPHILSEHRVQCLRGRKRRER
eukprot:scaffold1403_cov241-Pinguiococcus_pyrenoidosus.AAC.1